MRQFLSVILIVKLAFMERYPDLPYVAFQMQSNGKYLFKYSYLLSDHMYLEFCSYSKV